jgi:hypothetical protein
MVKNAAVLHHSLIETPVSFGLIFPVACRGLQREECGDFLRNEGACCRSERADETVACEHFRAPSIRRRP